MAEKKGHSGLLGYFKSLADSKKKGNMEFSLGNLFSCLCCTSEDQTDSKKELILIIVIVITALVILLLVALVTFYYFYRKGNKGRQCVLDEC